jgi:type I restriction enzyme M protein
MPVELVRREPRFINRDFEKEHREVDQATHNKIVSFIWGIADDVLRDLFKRGKYPDVILPMCVIRRMDAVLEPSKQAVLDTKKMLDDARITEQRAALCDAAGQAFYNTSKFTLRDLKSCGSQQQLLADFEDYLNGFSPNVQDILDNFKFRNQLSTLSKADAIGTLINKFLDPEIDLSPAGIDNHSMGTVFEELVRKFNEENNEEAGEHWTPRDAVRLMANLVFLPMEKEIKSGTYLLYDCACAATTHTLSSRIPIISICGTVTAASPGWQHIPSRRLASTQAKTRRFRGSTR